MNIYTMLIVAFLCLAIGYIAGVLVSTLTTNRAKVNEDFENTTPEPAAPYDLAILHRSNPSDPLEIELDRTSYTKAASLKPDQQQRLAAWIGELQSWLGLPHFPQVSPEPAKNEPLLQAQPNGSKIIETRLEPVAKPTQPSTPKSIVGQIDDILQDQINGTTLAGRGIRLVEAPGEGVVVWIGLQHFVGIDAVTDSEVLAAIRSAVKIWEAKIG